MKHKKRAKTSSTAKSQRTTRKTPKSPIIIRISLLILVIFVITATIFKITEFALTSKTDNFPKLEISLKDVSLEEINAGAKDIKYPDNTISLTIDNKSTTYEGAEVKGRGNSTWGQIKKPYQIKFNNKVDLFNHGNAKKWILLANYLDPTSLRTDFSFYLESALNSDYPLKGSFAELYVNNIYYGLYYITEKIEIEKTRINLTEPDGVIIELDNIYGLDVGCKYDQHEDCFIIKDSANKDNQQFGLDSFMEKFELLRDTIKLGNYDKINELIDVDSFAKYFLLNEFVINPDAYSTSFFMYKDGDKDKIHAGPGWDFDLSLGNTNWITEGIDQDILHSPFETMTFKNYLDEPEKAPHTWSISTILYDLIDIPEFSARVKEIYQQTLSGKGDKLLDYIKNQANYIRDAALRDQERWKLKTNFDDEVDYLIDWVAKRYDHFEQTYGTNSTVETPGEAIPDLAPESQPPSKE